MKIHDETCASFVNVYPVRPCNCVGREIDLSDPAHAGEFIEVHPRQFDEILEEGWKKAAAFGSKWFDPSRITQEQAEKAWEEIHGREWPAVNPAMETELKRLAEMEVAMAGEKIVYPSDVAEPEGNAERASIVCRYCGFIHRTKCPLVSAIEYYPDGNEKRVEFYAPPPAGVVNPQQMPNPQPYRAPTS